jgi:hypothetical protein
VGLGLLAVVLLGLLLGAVVLLEPPAGLLAAVAESFGPIEPVAVAGAQRPTIGLESLAVED